MARQRNGGAGEAGQQEAHRWAIDRIEEGTAAVEQDGDHLYEIPRCLIPGDARDGDVLAVTIAAAGAGEVTVSVRIDRAARGPQPASAPPKKSATRGAPRKDRGGDIVL